REDVLNTSRTKGVVEGYHEGEAKGRAEGLQEGFAKGRAEGRAEERTAIAAKMKQLGIPAEQIAQSTGIPVGETQEKK
ncbi:MAG: hypothetical protein IJM65_06215, partial [Bacteroidales bacterium]|nr:hypothetical protein [Bacteroidales bacterium]